MSKSTIVRDSRPRQKSARGLNPTSVFSIAVGVMICGFAMSDRQVDTVEQPSVVITMLPPGNTDDVTQVASEKNPADPLTDEDRLYQATVWLARCIYSETDRAHEQELVAWVVRNRVETTYRGESTYSGVITDPFQFSAFNRRSPMRDFLLVIDSTYTAPKWQQAMDVARQVILADADLRPFPITTRHFYSERSLGDAEIPLWALEVKPIRVHPYKVDEKRFRFFDKVS
jgi:hypothetical protein